MPDSARASGLDPADRCAERGPDIDDYRDAAALLEGNLQGLVRNEAVEPHWIGDSGRFWYRRDGDDGPEFVAVTAQGEKSPAFDHARLARVLGEVVGDAAPGPGLPASLAQAQLTDDLGRFTARIDTRSVECDLTSWQCRVLDSPTPSLERLESPDGRHALFVRDDNLFVLVLATNEERQLTNDGTPLHSWAKPPDVNVTTVARRRAGQKAAPFDTFWSPCGRYVIAPRVDERSVGIHPVVEWIPGDGSRRPIVHQVRRTLSGDPDRLTTDYFLFDIETGIRSRIDLPAGYQRGPFSVLLHGWSRGRNQAFLLAETIGAKSVGVFRLDLATAAVSQVLEESSATRVETNTLQYGQPNLRLLGDGAQLIWYSDRTGWGHLYLYDAQSGALAHAITAGDWLVLDIHAVDVDRREIYFSAVGREAGRDPYFRHLYRVPIDGSSSPILLTDIDADHHFQPNMSQAVGIASPQPLIAPKANVFIDTWSRVDQPPVSALRACRDGKLVAELERADASRLYATGWKPPVRERVKAADGETDLYPVYFAPYGRFEDLMRPVIDAAYAGPQLVVAPRNFTQAYGGSPLGKNALARLGFAVVVVDARGTPMRSSAFRDAGFVEFTKVAIDDHIAAIRTLAGHHPEIDLDRVGTYGWSWGGTFAAQAILERPEFYKVAVSGAGVYDYAAMSPGFECMTGVPAYAEQAPVRTRPDEAPANWHKLDVTRLAGQLTGWLLIAYADLDENVPPNQALRLVHALTEANKPYDLVCLANRTHASGAVDGYLTKRTWDYFVEHFLGATAVPEFKVEMRPPR